MKSGSFFKYLCVLMSAAIIFVMSSCSTNTGLNDALNGTDKPAGEQNTNLSDAETEPLPTVKSFDDLLSIMTQFADQNTGVRYTWNMRAGAEMPESSGKAAAAVTDSASVSSDHSTTNVQVDGVDEADIVKTDGEYIYQVSERQIVIAKAYPADNMSIAKVIKINEEDFYPFEIYLDDKYLVVIGSSWREITIPEIKPDEPEESETPADGKTADQDPAKSSRKIYMPYVTGSQTTRVCVYDIEKPENASLVKTFEIDGSYISSRKIGSQLYLVTNKYQYYYFYENKPSEEEVIPYYRDSSSGKEFVPLAYSSIHYFPDAQDSNFLVIAGMNLDRIDQEPNIEAYLGSGQTIYASEKNLYIAMSVWEYEEMKSETADDAGKDESDTTSENADDADKDVSDDSSETAVKDIAIIRPIIYGNTKVSTKVYRFALMDGKAVYAADGEIPGSLLNQFSMDEHNGYFRAATTTNQMWWGFVGSSDNVSKNNLYVLDSGMNITGKIEDIAPGEQIYSVRFMGDKAYMVTYRTVDPLFAIDLKDPSNPSILGYLKIPGYSSYLHPYDENHIIGFGMDTVETEVRDDKGNVIGTTAYQTGLKVAMFDVSDMTNPTQLFDMEIGDRGSYSDLLYNHKALLFSKERNLMAFPVTEMTVKSAGQDVIMDYGTFAFQGLYVLGIDMEDGFILKARISHLTPQEVENAETEWYDYSKTVERAIYIDDTLYSISKSMIKAHDMNDYHEKAELKLPYIGYYK